MIKSLCIVDDNEVDIYQVTRVVKKSGLVEQFFSFCDGQDALDHFFDFEGSKKKFEGNFPPVAIILDINMPRKNGFEFLEEYSQLPPEHKTSLIVMMLTSSDQGKDKERAKQFSEVKDYFLKPFTNEHLQKIIKMIEEN
jgi:CheY-like chemotaxis protein